MSGVAIVTTDQSGDIEGALKREACADLKLAPSKLLWVFHAWGVKGVTGVDFTQSGTSSRAFQSGPPASLRITTPGTGANAWNAWAGATDGTGRPKHIKAGAAAKWWICSLFALQDASAAGSITGVGAIDVGGTGFVFAGDNGAVSTANYSVRGNAGANINSGRALDVNVPHRHKIYRDGTNGFYQIDAFAKIAGDIRPNADACLAVTVQDAAAVQHRLDLVYWAAATPLV